MSPEDELRRRLGAEFGTHDADTARIRSRFDAGVAAELRARRSAAHPATPRHRRPSREIISRPPSPRKRLASAGLAVALSITVVCGVTVAAQSATRHDSDLGPPRFADPTGVSSSSAASEPTSAQPTPAPTPVPPVRPPATTSPTVASPTAASPTAASPTATSPAATSSTAASAASVTRCGAYDSVSAGSFMIDNNLWAADRGTGTQCVRTAPGPATSIGWSSTWDWSGGPGQVKSFASAVLGWRWGYAPGPGAGLPVQLSDHPAIRTHWAYTLTQSRAGDLDVAYDVWLHSTPHPGNDMPPAAEMRVLLNKVPSGAAGSTSLGTFTVDGGTWNLYLNVNGWNVYSFVRSTPANGPVDLNLTDFTDTLAQLGRLPPALYVTSVQAGVDVIDGAGALTTSAYSVTVD